MSTRRVTADHKASYSDPIAVAAADPLMLTLRKDRWDGHLWLWAVGPDGRAGWVPESLVCWRAGTAVAAEDYTARELTCRAGETVSVMSERGGWAWCEAADGRTGWVPLRVLAPSDGAA